MIESLSLTKITKNKIQRLKNSYLLICSSFLLAKQKRSNVDNLKRITKNKLLFWKHGLEEAERFIQSNNLLESYNKLNGIADDMKRSIHLKNLVLYNILNTKVNDKLKTVFQQTDRIFANIFLSKKENYKELFMFNISMCNLDEYLNVNVN